MAALSDVIHVNKHTQYANCGLHVNLVNAILFYDEKGSFFKQKLLLWPQVSFKFMISELVSSSGGLIDFLQRGFTCN